MKHVMIDLETMGKTPRAAVVQIGAVVFDPMAGELGREFKVRVDLKRQGPGGREIDPDTVAWWMTQSERARFGAVSPKAGPWGLASVDLETALIDLGQWLDDLSGGSARAYLEGVWAHGILFDVAILEHAHRQLRHRVPWHHRAPRDTRTLFALACPGVDAAKVIDDLAGPPPEDFVRHDALHDARRQAKAVCAAYLRLGAVAPVGHGG